MTTIEKQTNDELPKDDPACEDEGDLIEVGSVSKQTQGSPLGSRHDIGNGLTYS